MGSCCFDRMAYRTCTTKKVIVGADPTDTNSVFTATITMVDGEPVVEWSPKLSAAEESRRRYTIYGKAGLESGEEWHSPTNALDRFFTVGVEMK